MLEQIRELVIELSPDGGYVGVTETPGLITRLVICEMRSASGGIA